MKSSRTVPRLLWNVLAALVIAGCATTLPRSNPTFDEGRGLIESGQLEQGLAKVQEASKQDPTNHEIRSYYFRARDAAAQHYIAIGDAARSASQFKEAEEAYKRAQALDPSTARAKAGLEAIATDATHRAMLTEAQTLLDQGKRAEAYAKAREILAEDSSFHDAQAFVRKIEIADARAAVSEPALSPALRKPVTMEFRDAPIRSVFELISQHTGLNFVFDRDVRTDLRATVFVRDTAVEDVIRFVLVTNQLERKVLNENTLLIYPNTPAKNKDYRDLVMKSFYLANADAKQTANMIKAMIKTPDMYVDEKLNMVVIRDTPEAVRVAERLVMNQDLAEPEVMLEVEVLEVGTNLLTELGVQWPDHVGFGLIGAAGTAGSITLPEWLNRSSNLVRMTTNDPFLAINLKKQDGRTNVLANPRIRVKNHEKAKIHIGDRVPVITTTASATGFVAESVNYLDVGLKLEVEPSVYLEDDVGIKIGLEVSNIAQQIKTNSGTLAYQLGTREANTVLRLKDGETQVLAGLINDEDRRSAAKIPGLGDMPVLGHLFGSTNVNANKTEIVLLITPHVVRNLTRPDARLEEFHAGSDSQVGRSPLVLPKAGGASRQGTVLDLPRQSSAAPAPAAPASASVPPSIPPSTVPAAPAGVSAAPSARFALQAPGHVSSGQEFSVAFNVDDAAAIHKGTADFIFDTSRLRFVRAEKGDMLQEPQNDVAPGEQYFHVNAPRNLGRVSLSFSTRKELKGPGTAARLVFQTVGSGAAKPDVRVDGVAAADGAGHPIAVQAPAPLSLAISN